MSNPYNFFSEFLINVPVNLRAPVQKRTSRKSPPKPAKKSFDACNINRRDFDLLQDITGIDWRPSFVCELTIQNALVEGLAHAVSHRESLNQLIICCGGHLLSAYRVSLNEVISKLGASSNTGNPKAYRLGRFFPGTQGIVAWIQCEIKGACGAILRERFRHGFYTGTVRVVERGQVKMKRAKLTQLPLRKTEDGDSVEIDYSNVRVGYAPEVTDAYAAIAAASNDPFFQTV